MWKKVSILWVFLFGIPMMGCWDDCGDFGSYTYSVVSFETNTAVFDFDTELLSEPMPDGIPFESFVIHLKTITELIAASDGTNSPALIMACSPPPPTILSRITSVRITSDSAFSADYPAGADLSDIFRIASFDFERFSQSALVDDWLVVYGGLPFEFFIYPTVPPDMSGTYRFFIELEFEGSGLTSYQKWTSPTTIIV